jgi:DNA-binding CsgD family transcriptional regulator
VSLSMTEHRRWLTRALATSAEPSPERADALVTAALVASLQGDQPAAATLVKEARALADEVGSPRCVAFTAHTAGLTAFFSDDFTTAAALFADAERLYRAAGSDGDILVAALDVQIGLLGISRGDLDGARERFAAQLERSLAAEETWIRSYALDGLGFIALLSHDVDEARRLAREALTATSRFDDTIGLSLALDLTAWTAAADGRYERCAVLLGAASSRWGSFGNQLYGSPDWQARRQGYEQQARDTLGEPIFDTAFRHGATMGAQDILGYALTDAPEPLHAADEYLTDREYEIAGHVARGMTNREIADRLVLSHRTVEGHVSRVLTKLGFSRRAQLAAWMERTRTTHSG